eukprot:PITA_05634
MPLVPQVNLQVFDKWNIDFVKPINPPGQRIGVRYIISAIDYLLMWAEAQPVKDCNTKTAVKFIFEYILSRFGCPKILISDQGSHLLNNTIEALTEEFQVYHKKRTPYHTQENGTEAFNKILENALTKVCNMNRDDWDLRIPIVLWAYRTTCKNLTGTVTTTDTLATSPVAPPAASPVVPPVAASMPQKQRKSPRKQKTKEERSKNKQDKKPAKPFKPKKQSKQSPLRKKKRNK